MGLEFGAAPCKLSSMLLRGIALGAQEPVDVLLTIDLPIQNRLTEQRRLRESVAKRDSSSWEFI
jgi:hypothetical protein